MAEPLVYGHSPQVLEFVGLPGAGKTTVLEQVMVQLRAEQKATVSRSEILEQWREMPAWQQMGRLLPRTWNQWSILLRSFELALQVKPITKQSLAKASRIFSNVRRFDAVTCHQPCPLILLDQGMLQEVWSVGITGNPPSRDQVKQSVAPLFYHRAIAIVYFKVDVETALWRIQNRATQSSRLDRMHPEMARLSLSNYAPYLETIIDCVQSLNVPVLELEDSLSIDEKATKIVRWIMNSTLD